MAKKKAVKKTAVKKGSAEAKRKMAKVRKAKKNYVLVEKDRQTKVKTTNSGGYLYNYNKKKDASKKAMPPGKRISKKTGNPYWEYRVNRSDKKGSLTGEKHYDTNSHNYNFTISGVNKDSVLNKLYKDYGTIQSQIYQAKTKGQKNIFKRLLTDVKAEINKIKKLK
jgi:hypothetical protein